MADTQIPRIGIAFSGRGMRGLAHTRTRLDRCPPDLLLEVWLPNV